MRASSLKANPVILVGTNSVPLLERLLDSGRRSVMFRVEGLGNRRMRKRPFSPSCQVLTLHHYYYHYFYLNLEYSQQNELGWNLNLHLFHWRSGRWIWIIFSENTWTICLMSISQLYKFSFAMTSCSSEFIVPLLKSYVNSVTRYSNRFNFKTIVDVAGCLALPFWVKLIKLNVFTALLLDLK